MKKAKGAFCLLSILFFSILSSVAIADGQYKITANIIDMEHVCYITGIVTDASGNGVYPAEVTFICGSIQTKVPVLPGGAYIGNPPPCNDYTITATAPGTSPATSISFIGTSLTPAIHMEFWGLSCTSKSVQAQAVLT